MGEDLCSSSAAKLALRCRVVVVDVVEGSELVVWGLMGFDVVVVVVFDVGAMGLSE